MADRRSLVIHAQYKKSVGEPDEYAIFAMDPVDIKTWYLLLRNMKGNHDEYDGGQYIFRMVIPDDFPYKPPQFYALTPNGLYEQNSKCCISIGEYHSRDYRPTLGMRGFSIELANGMITWEKMGTGINLLNTSWKEKQKLALNSVEFNKKHHKKELDLLYEAFAGYSKNWDKIPPNCTMES